MRDILEYSIIAMMFLSPEKQPPKLRTEAEMMAETLKTYKTLTEIKFHLPTIPEGRWEFLASRIKMYSKMDEKVRELEWLAATKAIEDMDKGEKILEQLKEAVEFTKKGNFAEVGKVLANIDLSTKDNSLEETKETLKSSLTDGEAFMLGIKEFDDCGGLYTGNLMTIIGDTGGMKTMISVWLTLQVLKANKNFTSLYFEKEMPVKDIARRLVSNMLKISAGDIKRAMSKKRQGDPSDLLKIEEMIEEGFEKDTDQIFSRFKIVPTTEFNSAEDMKSFVLRHNPDFWTLDFITSLGEDGVMDDMYMFMKRQMDTLKSIVHQTNSFGLLLGQIKQNVLTDRANKIPLLADAEWSSKINQLSAYVYASFFPKNYYTANYVNQNYYYLAKRKGREEMPDFISLLAYPEWVKFEDPDKAIADMKKWYMAYVSTKGKQ